MNENVNKEMNKDEEVHHENHGDNKHNPNKKYKNNLKVENEKLKEEISDLKNQILKVKADEINFKKRIEEERDKVVKYANQNLLEKMITQLDLFDKVVSMETDDPTLKNFLLGFQMINTNLKQVLEDEGIKKIVVKVGDKPDPRYHHELQTGWDENYEENVILQELQSGYMYKDRVLRPSLIKVNKKEEGK